jgi:hypothetical protein
MAHLYELDLPLCHQAPNISFADSEKLRHGFDVDQLRNAELTGPAVVCHSMLLPNFELPIGNISSVGTVSTASVLALNDSADYWSPSPPFLVLKG